MTSQGKLVSLISPQPADYPALKDILNDQVTMEILIPYFGVTEWTDAMIHDRYEKFRIEEEAGVGTSWAIYCHAAKKIVGNCGFKKIDKKKSEAEFGIIVHRDYWGKGHAGQAVILSLNYAFEDLQLKRVYFITDQKNIRMQKFFEKVGIRFVGHTEDGFLQYETLATEWAKLKKMLQN